VAPYELGSRLAIPVTRREGEAKIMIGGAGLFVDEESWAS
jgi:hypothetical protein